MRKVFIAVVAFGLVTAYGVTGRSAAAQTAGSAPVGTAEAGKAHYAFGNTSCSNCHGAEGQGAFGPDLQGNPIFSQKGAIETLLLTGRGEMPAVGRGWSDRQMNALLAYVKRFAGNSSGG